MDLLEKGARFLEQQRTRFMTQTVVIRRGASQTTVQATIGKHVFQVDHGDGLLSEWHSRDYLVLATEYAFDDVPTEPGSGDQFLEGDLSDAIVYEVMAPSGEQVWRWSDNYRLTYRIHTKHVGTSPATP